MLLFLEPISLFGECFTSGNGVEVLGGFSEEEIRAFRDIVNERWEFRGDVGGNVIPNIWIIYCFELAVFYPKRF